MNSNPFQNTPLHAAAEQGDAGRVRFLLQNGDDPNAFRIDGYTPLHCAVSIGRDDIAEILLRHGSDPNRRRPERGTETMPIHLAVENGQYDLVRILLDSGADPNCVSRWNKTPLWLALELHLLAIVRLIEDRGGRIHSFGSIQDALDRATRDEHLFIMEHLLQAGAKGDLADPSKRKPSAFFHALYYRRKRAVKLLLEMGADPNKICSWIPDQRQLRRENRLKWMPMYPINFACFDNSGDIAEMLIRAKARFDQPGGINNRTPAVDANVTHCNYRIESDGTVTRRQKEKSSAASKELTKEFIDDPRFTPLHRAVFNRDGELVDQLLRDGADPNAMVDFDPVHPWYAAAPYHSPLAIAIELQDVPIAKRLIRAGAVVKREGKHVDFALIRQAICSGNLEMLQLLLRHGVSINDRSQSGWYTPLILAIETGQTEMVRFLLEQGANPFLRSSMRWTPLMKAVWWGRNKIPSSTAKRDELTAIMLEFLPCEPDKSSME